MNYRLVSKLLGLVLATLALAFAASLAAGFVVGDAAGLNTVTRGWLISIAVAVVLSVGFYRFGRGAPNKLFRKEALAVIGLGWLVAAAIGSVPYMLLLPAEMAGGPLERVVNAFFESSSGITTTGASVFTGIERMPESLRFWRCLSQWIGGLGVVVFFVAILSFLGAGAKILYSHEASASSADIDSARIQSGVLRIGLLYLILSGACLLAYSLLGMNAYDAVCHTFTTISTGGFGTHSNSFAAFDSAAIEWTAIAFMILGGTSFPFLIALMRRQWRQARHNSEVPAYLIALLVFTCAVTLVLVMRGEDRAFHDNLREAAFHVTSIMTSTGYSAEDYNLWPGGGHVLLLIAMVLGGCSGSTAGGIKTVRFYVGAAVSIRNVERHFRPNVVRPVRVNNRVIDRREESEVAVYFLIAGMLVIISLFVLTLLQPVRAFEDLLSSIFACLFNIGPGFGSVGPLESYGFYDPVSKVFLSLLMITGRLEFFAILALLAPSLWRRFS